MPNLKIYVDDAVYRDRMQPLTAVLGDIRACIMRHLGVPQAACHLIIVPVTGLPDQALINLEMQMLPHPDRTRARIEALGREIADLLAVATGARSAFRCMQHAASSYVVLA